MKKTVKKNNPIAYLNAFKYAIEGFVYAFTEHTSFKIEVLAALFVLLFGYFYQLERNDWLIIFVVIFSVLVAELLNTSIETALDYMSKEHHVDVKIAKDVSAGAVLLLSFGAVIIGIIIFWPYIFN